MIAHQGTSPNDISQLIGRLETYFVTTFHDIVHTIRQRQLHSLGEVFESRSGDFRYLIGRMKQDNPSSIGIRFVATGYAELDNKKGPYLWSELVPIRAT